MSLTISARQPHISPAIAAIGEEEEPIDKMKLTLTWCEQVAQSTSHDGSGLNNSGSDSSSLHPYDAERAAQQQSSEEGDGNPGRINGVFTLEDPYPEAVERLAETTRQHMLTKQKLKYERGRVKRERQRGDELFRTRIQLDALVRKLSGQIAELSVEKEELEREKGRLLVEGKAMVVGGDDHMATCFPFSCPHSESKGGARNQHKEERTSPACCITCCGCCSFQSCQNICSGERSFAALRRGDDKEENLSETLEEEGGVEEEGGYFDGKNGGFQAYKWEWRCHESARNGDGEHGQEKDRSNSGRPLSSTARFWTELWDDESQQLTPAAWEYLKCWDFGRGKGRLDI